MTRTEFLASLSLACCPPPIGPLPPILAVTESHFEIMQEEPLEPPNPRKPWPHNPIWPFIVEPDLAWNVLRIPEDLAH